MRLFSALCVVNATC